MNDKTMKLKKTPDMSPSAIMGKQTFNERMIDVIPFIDPDSTRMVEWIWAVRHNAGLSTHSRSFTVPANVEVKIRDIIPFLEGHFETTYNSDYYYRGVRNNKETGLPDFFAVIGRSNGTMMVVCAGDKEEVEPIIEALEKEYIPPKTIKTNHLMGFNGDGEPRIKEEILAENEVSFGTDAFYPCIEEGIDQFIADFKKSKSNVILLIGPPGTGKSTLLRTILFKMDMKHIHLAYNEGTLMNPLFSNWLEGIPKKSVIGIEDADTFVSTRDNQNYQMSALLNYIEGVIPTNNKLIISTNLETTNRVDPALLRVGRNFRVLEFRNLDHKEANKARKSIGLKALKFLPQHKEMSLAMALNYENVNAKHFKNHKRQGVGFIGRD